jgi:hypothetical protein
VVFLAFLAPRCRCEPEELCREALPRGASCRQRGEQAAKRRSGQEREECPRRDSNPCYSLERAVT